jgi:phospholipid/cholesterol/gamma-HCH transport system substrate-binding protein
VQTRPFLRETTPVIRDEIRPFVRASRPAVKELRPAMRDLSALQPDLLTTFRIVNRLLNTLAYNPPGDASEGFLFWASWVNHLGPAIFSNQDAQGPIRRGLVVIGCQSLQLLENVVLGNPQLGTLVQLLEAPDRLEVCPQSAQTPGAGG